MSTPAGDHHSLYELQVEVEEEMTLVETTGTEEADLPVSEWLFDPTDVEREEVGLRGLLGAVEALEGGDRPAGNA
jgi:hypothetical protein